MPVSFNPKSLLANMNYVKNMVRRIRNKEGGIGSDADELVLSRLVFDVDFLIELAEALSTNNQKLSQALQEREAQNESGASREAGDSRDQNIQLDQTPP